MNSQWRTSVILQLTANSRFDCCHVSELAMPCEQYKLELQNSVTGPDGDPDLPVASLDQSTSSVSALQQGHIHVVLDHKSILQTAHT